MIQELEVRAPALARAVFMSDGGVEATQSDMIWEDRAFHTGSIQFATSPASFTKNYYVVRDLPDENSLMMG